MQRRHEYPEAYAIPAQGFTPHLAAMYPREQLDAALREIARQLFEHAMHCQLTDEEAMSIAGDVMREHFGTDPERDFQEVMLALDEAYAQVKFALHGPERAVGEDLRLRFFVV